MPKPKFEKGNKFGKGGARAGAGRKPSWFKELCEEELTKNKAAGVRLVGEISRGEAVVEKIFQFEGEAVRVETGPAPGDIIAANEFLRDSSVGRPAQAIEHTGEIGVDIFDLIRRAEKERGLPSSFDD